MPLECLCFLDAFNKTTHDNRVIMQDLMMLCYINDYDYDFYEEMINFIIRVYDECYRNKDNVNSLLETTEQKLHNERIKKKFRQNG